jgi:hypothetical protein
LVPPRQPAGLRQRQEIRTGDAIRRAAAQLIGGKEQRQYHLEQIAEEITQTTLANDEWEFERSRLHAGEATSAQITDSCT